MPTITSKKSLYEKEWYIMSITANLTDPNGMNLSDRFVAINDNYKDYVKELKKEFPTQSG